MSQNPSSIRGFRATFIGIGVLYVMLASSMLVQGVGVLRDFAVPESAIAEPVLEDIFLFFYELMAMVGVLLALFGQAVRERRQQALVASVLSVLNLYLMWRDLSTSDTPFGNHLYKNPAMLIPVFISLTLALVFAGFAWAGWRVPREAPPEPRD